MAFLLVPIVLSGCATETRYRKNLQGWVGKPIGDLTRAWRTPTRSVTNADGTTTYEWRTSDTSTIEGVRLPTGQIIQRQETRQWCDTKVFTGPDGIIRSWTIAGNNCKAR